MAFYSEARRVVTEKTPFRYTPAQHAGLLHPLKSQGRVTVARILPEPVGWTEQCWEPWELEAVLVRAEGQSDTYLSQSRFRGNRRAVARVLNERLAGMLERRGFKRCRVLSPSGHDWIEAFVRRPDHGT